MKILFVSLYDARFGLGGAERVALDLAYAMKRRHHTVKFMINQGDALEELNRSEISAAEIPWEKIKIFELISKLKQMIEDFKPDIIHSHHRYITFILDTFFKSKCRILHTEEVLRKDKRAFFRYGHFAAACHESVKENLIQYYGVPANRVQTILNAVARPQPSPEILAKLRSKYPLEGRLTGFCIARFEKQKGHRYLIDAVAELSPERRKKLRIFLAGDGILKESCMKQAREKQVGDVFVFLGYCKEVPEFLAMCDFTILSSIWEGSPLTLLLSFGAGKPVIGTDIDGIRGVVKDGETGLLAKPAEAASMAQILRSVIDHPENIKAMGAATEKYWNQYSSMERTAGEYQECYRRLLEL